MVLLVLVVNSSMMLKTDVRIEVVTVIPLYNVFAFSVVKAMLWVLDCLAY